MKRALFSILLLLGTFSLAKAGQNDSLETAAPKVSAEALVDSMIRMAVEHLGTGYCRGGVGNKNCFDCSGFVSEMYAYFGYVLPHTSAGISKLGDPVKKADIRPGDVIYFKGSNAKSKRVGHVGIVVQNDGHTITFIHASVNKGICFDDLDSRYYSTRFLGARRFIY